MSKNIQSYTYKIPSAIPECIVAFIYSSGDECNVFRIRPEIIGAFEYELRDHVICVSFDSQNKKLTVNIKMPQMNLSPFEVLWVFINTAEGLEPSTPPQKKKGSSRETHYEYEFGFNELEKIHVITFDNPNNIELFLGIYLGENGAKPISARLYESQP